MRPICKGDWPQNNGNNIDFNAYSDARPFLLNHRIGDFCSYCENQISNPAVEHIQAKIINPELELNWYNFLVGCVNCNSTKGHDHLNLDDFYWPDVHNTYLLFDYHPLGIVTLKSSYPNNINRDKAERTLRLTGLQRYGSTASNADRRWIKRSEAWGKASEALTYYNNNNYPQDFVQIIINNATSSGFWSVWMTVFAHHTEVKDALIEAFLGTLVNCETTDIDRL